MKKGYKQLSMLDQNSHFARSTSTPFIRIMLCVYSSHQAGDKNNGPYGWPVEKKKKGFFYVFRTCFFSLPHQPLNASNMLFSLKKLLKNNKRQSDFVTGCTTFD